jgi:hypothetical protein
VHFWQSLLSGAAVLYLVALCLGPISGIGWAWLAAVAVWQSALLLPLTASPQVTENWRRWAETHRLGRLNWLVAASVALLAIGEGTLRIRKLLSDGNPGADAVELARLEADVRAADVETDWALGFGVERGRFRVALLNNESRSATKLTMLSHRIQQTVPGADVVRLEATLADADIAQLAAELETIKPDVVLAVLPACGDWAPNETRRSLFDSDRFHLSKVVFSSAESDEPSPVQMAANYEEFLNLVSADLHACRTPLDDMMRARWERTFAALDSVVDTCRTARTTLALVVVPGELQVNPGLRTTLLRRCGMTTEQVDVELPQRRIAGYAGQREVPVLDLLPQLRLSRQAMYTRNQMTLSERGNIEAAEAIGGWLESRFGGQISEQLSRNK